MRMFVLYWHCIGLVASNTNCLKLSIVNLQTRLIILCHYISRDSSRHQWCRGLNLKQSAIVQLNMTNVNLGSDIFPIINHIEAIFFKSSSVTKILPWVNLSRYLLLAILLPDNLPCNLLGWFKLINISRTSYSFSQIKAVIIYTYY